MAVAWRGRQRALPRPHLAPWATRRCSTPAGTPSCAGWHPSHRLQRWFPIRAAPAGLQAQRKPRTLRRQLQQHSTTPRQLQRQMMGLLRLMEMQHHVGGT